MNSQSLKLNNILHDKYKVIGILGSGGFGITYKAKHIHLDKVVAIKEFFPTMYVNRNGKKVQPNSDESLSFFKMGIEKFLKEAQILSRFNHPNIVKAIDYFKENNTAYLVMEYYNGKTLGEFIKRKRKMSSKHAVQILNFLLAGLKEVHSHGILHRDIKPDNIFITRKGQVKLIDFGAARYVIGKKSKSLTVILTPGYAPFEQYKSDKSSQGPWTDIYAVAATFYSICSGKVLPDAIGMQENPEKVNKLIDSLDAPVKVRESIKKALKFKKDDRYKTIEQFQDALLKGNSKNNMKNKYEKSNENKDYSPKSFETDRRKMSVIDIYFSLRGRVNRKVYWLYLILPSFLVGTFSGLTGNEEILSVFMFIIIYPTISISVKRLHDLNKSGKWYFIFLIPYIGPLINIIWLGFFEGTYGKNDYGEMME